MKKSIVILGAIAVVLLMVSTSTAVPQTQSMPTMEETKDMLQKKLADRPVPCPIEPPWVFFLQMLMIFIGYLLNWIIN